MQFSFFDLGRIDELVHVGTYLLAAAFLAVNWRVKGVWLVALGGLSNGLTIALNGGTLPARAAALREAGLRVKRTDFVNSGVMAHAHLHWLGDMFAVPEGRAAGQRLQRRRRHPGHRGVRRRAQPGPPDAP